MYIIEKNNIGVSKKGKIISSMIAFSMDVSKTSAYLDYEWAIVLNRACLKLLGVWPYDEETKRKKLVLDLYVISLLITMICSCIIPLIHSLVRIIDDFMSIVDNLQYTLPFSMATIKLFILWRKKKRLVPILKMIKEDWLKLKTENERHVMINRARIIRIITIYGYFIALISVTFCIIMTYFGFSLKYIRNATDIDKQLPLPSYYIYDINKSPSYEITFVLQTFNIILAGCIYSGTDNFFGLLVFHICGQFENLSSRVRCLKQNDFENKLSYNVQEHRRLIRSIKITDDAFTIMLLALLIYFGIIFAIYGFFFISLIKHGQDVSYFRITLIILNSITVFTHTCYYCILGEILVMQFDRFYKTTCDCKWYKLTPKSAKNLMTVMIYAKKPICITAGGLFPMTMSTFCNLLKTSGSYISVLLARDE